MAREIGAFDKYRINGDFLFISSGPVVVQALIAASCRGGTVRAYTEGMAALPPEGNSAECCRKLYPFQGPEIDELHKDAVKFWTARGGWNKKRLLRSSNSLGRSPSRRYHRRQYDYRQLVRGGLIDQG